MPRIFSFVNPLGVDPLKNLGASSILLAPEVESRTSVQCLGSPASQKGNPKNPTNLELANRKH